MSSSPYFEAIALFLATKRFKLAMVRPRHNNRNKIYGSSIHSLLEIALYSLDINGINVQVSPTFFLYHPIMQRSNAKHGFTDVYIYLVGDDIKRNILKKTKI